MSRQLWGILGIVILIILVVANEWGGLILFGLAFLCTAAYYQVKNRNTHQEGGDKDGSTR